MAVLEMLHKLRLILNTGAEMPAVGFGTLLADLSPIQPAVEIALDKGFRLLDCAERFRNEKEVGEALQAALKKGTMRRSDLFVITKLWNNNHRPERVRSAFDASLKRLKLDYLDLYLIHTPFAFQAGDDQDPRDLRGEVMYDQGVTLLETWSACEALMNNGRCRAIGLSDVTLAQLQMVYAYARIKPAVVQVEAHPYLPQWELLEYCKSKNIIFQAFASLGHGLKPLLMGDPIIVDIANKLNKTPAQVLLSWALQRGTAFLTSSRSAAHLQENLNLYSLPEKVMHRINTEIQTKYRFNKVAVTGEPGFIPRGH